MNEQKDELLQAFENPEVESNVEAQIAPETNNVEQNIMPQEFQQALEGTPAPQQEAEVKVETPVEPEITEEVTEEPNQGMQNVPDQVSYEPSVSVARDLKNEKNNDEETSYKKVILFLAPIVIIIIVFIMLLPTISKM